MSSEQYVKRIDGSGRAIKVNGRTYQKLLSEGVKFSSAFQRSENSSSKTTSRHSTRKSPSESSTLFAVNTKKQGNDGHMYEVKMRSTGSHYWAKSSQSGGNPILAALPSLSKLAIPVGLVLASNLAGTYLTPKKSTSQKGGSSSRQRQSGGNILLKTAGDLIVPIGLTVSAHWLRDFLGEKKPAQQKGGNLGALLVQAFSDLSVPIGLTMGARYLTPKEQKQVNQSGGSDFLPMITDPIMKGYMYLKGINLLAPTTLVPLGILLAVYMAYNSSSKSAPAKQSGGAGQQLQSLVDNKDLEKFKTSRGLSRISSQTEMPFATIMNKHFFKQYVKNFC